MSLTSEWRLRWSVLKFDLRELKLNRGRHGVEVDKSMVVKWVLAWIDAAEGRLTIVTIPVAMAAQLHLRFKVGCMASAHGFQPAGSLKSSFSFSSTVISNISTTKPATHWPH